MNITWTATSTSTCVTPVGLLVTTSSTIYTLHIVPERYERLRDELRRATRRLRYAQAVSARGEVIRPATAVWRSAMAGLPDQEWFETTPSAGTDHPGSWPPVSGAVASGGDVRAPLVLPRDAVLVPPSVPLRRLPQ